MSSRARTAAVVTALLGLGALLPASAQAVRFAADISYQFTQPWQVVPPANPNCDVVGSGTQTVSFHIHRVIQVYGDQRRPNDPHPTTISDFGTPDRFQRTVSLSLTPSLDPERTCDPLPAPNCPTRVLRREGGGFMIQDKQRRIVLATGGGRGDLSAAQEALDRSGECPGPDRKLRSWWKTYLPIPWRGWRRLFRPGGRLNVTVDHAFGPVREDEPSRWSFGGYSWVTDISGRVHYTLSLRNVCRTIRIRGRRVCASGRS